MIQIQNIFDNFLKKESIFKNKLALSSNYLPKKILHREEQSQEIAQIFAPILRNESTSNLFVYGKTGTGKTLTVRHTLELLNQTAIKNKVKLKIIYLNCKLRKIADTEYRILTNIIREFGKEIPSTGLPTEEVYNTFFKIIQENNKYVLLVLDEIDQLVEKSGNEILYNLTRMCSELKQSQLSIIGISNDISFTKNLDARVKSSLSEEEILFQPYNALQIQDILKQRSLLAFKENLVLPGVIEKCSAYAAREHGDARRAIELLRVSAEISERTNSKKITLAHVDLAEEKIERDRILDTVSNQPKQFQAVLYSILSLNKDNKNKAIFTGEIFEAYYNTCLRSKVKPLTQRRVSDIISELDLLGVINCRVLSKGRYGRTREIKLAVPKQTLPKVKKILEQSLDLL